VFKARLLVNFRFRFQIVGRLKLGEMPCLKRLGMGRAIKAIRFPWFITSEIRPAIGEGVFGCGGASGDLPISWFVGYRRSIAEPQNISGRQIIVPPINDSVEVLKASMSIRPP
jgi:hypothetical protein